jgi:hypothetical protein
MLRSSIKLILLTLMEKHNLEPRKVKLVNVKKLYDDKKIPFDQTHYRHIAMLDLTLAEAHVLEYFYTNKDGFEASASKYCKSCFVERHPTQVNEIISKLLSLEYLKIIDNCYVVNTLKIFEDAKNNLKLKKVKNSEKRKRQRADNQKKNEKKVLIPYHTKVLIPDHTKVLIPDQSTILPNDTILTNVNESPTAEVTPVDFVSKIFENTSVVKTVGSTVGGAATPLYSGKNANKRIEQFNVTTKVENLKSKYAFMISRNKTNLCEYDFCIALDKLILRDNLDLFDSDLDYLKSETEKYILENPS